MKEKSDLNRLQNNECEKLLDYLIKMKMIDEKIISSEFVAFNNLYNIERRYRECIETINGSRSDLSSLSSPDLACGKFPSARQGTRL